MKYWIMKNNFQKTWEFQVWSEDCYSRLFTCYVRGPAAMEWFKETMLLAGAKVPDTQYGERTFESNSDGERAMLVALVGNQLKKMDSKRRELAQKRLARMLTDEVNFWSERIFKGNMQTPAQKALMCYLTHKGDTENV